MPDIVLKDRDGNSVTHSGISGVQVTLADGETHVLSFDGRPEDCHSVTFMDGDTVLWVRSVADGDDCADVVSRGLVAVPTKESTAQYDYTFNGWSLSDGGEADPDILTAVTEDKVVYAAYAAVVRYYVVSWYDGDSLIASEACAYGSTPEYTPTKDGFDFVGWMPLVEPVTGNMSYYAQWEEAAVDGIAYGICGDNVHWVLKEDGSLVIYGEGAMYDYTSITSTNPAPWVDYESQITSVIVEYGVTNLGANSFNGNTADSGVYIYSGLTSVELPSTLQTIGTGAFAYCVNATTITMQEGVTTIGVSAFYYWKKLQSIILPSTLTSIGSSAFHSSALTSITIPANVTHISKWAFQNNSALSSATFEDTSGWYVTQTIGATSGTDLTATNLANTSTAATYLKTTYRLYYWYKT